ncbi:sortase B [Anaerotaenia torta]|uniref:class B sortase n=1 Tax=Anaerotaenia torta TaxID=433293 RepID=UPI003D24865E
MPKKQKRLSIRQALQIVFITGFITFALLFINDVLITPYRINKSLEKASDYYSAEEPSEPEDTLDTDASEPDTPGQNAGEQNPDEADSRDQEEAALPDRDEQGRLLRFRKLLEMNDDVKGWIKIPDTNIDYVVMQSGREDPEYYLRRDWQRNDLKAGSLFLDARGSLEEHSRNLTIHGHNMTSTDNMFHYLVKFKELDYYKERPVFTFDSIYDTGKWKIFAVFITNGSSKKEEIFDYTRADFEDDADFLNFVYQLKIRSIYQIDSVDINETDQLLTLSTCSYEVKDYRTVVVARRVREGEEETVDTESAVLNPKPLFPYSYYYRYGGRAPKLSATFEEAYANGEIGWYQADTSQLQD